MEQAVTTKQHKQGYSNLFATPHVPGLVWSSVLARLPLGSSVMLMVLLVSSHYGATIAGSATALMTGSMAICAPILGKLIDMGKAPISLIVLGLAQFLCVLAMVMSSLISAPAAMILICALLAGVFTPPVAGTTRSLWHNTVPEDLVPVAYDLEVLVVDLLYVGGPLLASALLSIINAGTTLSIIYGFMACGCVLLAMSTPVRDYARTVPSSSDSATLQHPLLQDIGVVLLLLVCLLTGSFSGWIETAVPLLYSHLGQSALSGTAISLWSIGSIAGILLFTRFHPKHMPISKQLALFTSIYCLICTGLALPVNAYSIIIVLVLVGMAVSPGTSLQYQLAGQLAPANRQGEMFSWINTAMGVGLAIGSFGAGLVADHLGMQMLFLLPVGFVGLATACAIGLAFRSSR